MSTLPIAHRRFMHRIISTRMGAVQGSCLIDTRSVPANLMILQVAAKVRGVKGHLEAASLESFAGERAATGGRLWLPGRE